MKCAMDHERPASITQYIATSFVENKIDGIALASLARYQILLQFFLALCITTCKQSLLVALWSNGQLPPKFGALDEQSVFVTHLPRRIAPNVEIINKALIKQKF